nr:MULTISPECIES: hypothetical protein [unclassified Methanoregula]
MSVIPADSDAAITLPVDAARETIPGVPAGADFRTIPAAGPYC